MRPTDADALMPLFIKKAYTMKDRHGVKLGDDWLLNYNDIKDVIDNAPPVDPQNIVVIPPELIEKLASCVANIVGNIDWVKAIEAYKARPHGAWIKHIDNLYPEDSTEECPFCHEEQRLVGNDDNFCPNCGAEMRKEAENGNT